MNFTFEVIDLKTDENTYTDGCSGSRSDCCTRTCTNMDMEETNDNSDNNTDKWADYFELNAGLVQY